jgi:hypothetical protein
MEGTFEVLHVIFCFVAGRGIVSEKPSCQYLSLICDESLTCQGLNLNLRQFDGSTTFILFVWRIMFACLMMCRWQVRHGRQRRGSWQ